MNPVVVAIEYFTWQYTSGIFEYLRAWGNIHWFLYYFFSLPILVQTLFQPLFRIKEDYGRGIDFQKIAEAMTINLIMRITGLVVRLVLIVVGLVVEIAVFVLGICGFIIFLLSPIGVPIAVWIFAEYILAKGYKILFV